MSSNVAPPESALAPAQPGGALALLAGGRAETAKALAQAVSACHAVEKSSTNDYHKYRYASADAIIEEGRKALSAAGLVLLPIEATVNGFEREGPDRFELIRTFALLHASGEITPLRVCWPITPEKGRPLDKAAAIADTLSLSYLLRDLLLMPRVDPSDDVNARDDRPPAARQQGKGKGQRRPPADGAELRAFLERFEGDLVRQKRCQPGELFAHVRKMGTSLGHPADVTRWGPEALGLAGDWVRTFAAQHNEPEVNGQAASPPPAAAPPPAPIRFVTPERAKELQELVRKKGRSWARREKGDAGESLCRVFDLPETTMIEDLTAFQYAEIRKALLEEKDFVRS